MVLIWLEFIAVSAVIVYFGYRLSKYGDVIAERTGLGRVWVGTILLATVTSLPELFAGLSASAIVKDANIAIGNSIGSSAFNVAIVSVADLVSGPGAILVAGMAGVEVLAGFSIVLITLASASLVLAQFISLPAFAGIGIYTPAIFIIYLLGAREAFLYERKTLPRDVEEIAKEYRYEHIQLRTAVMQYILSAVVVIGAALLLPTIGEQIAIRTGLGTTFIGAVFIAFTTSLPEVVVSIAAVRIGATELALSNLFGSNMFNIAIVGFDDIFFRQGPILGAASASNAVTGLFAILMTALVIAGLNYPYKRGSRTRLSWETATILALFIISTVTIFYIT
ncbi:MAG TPA: sodium:calcium antiporter [Anaerolineae bacterium]|nr:sodium:calcium antiporter [Anaerolineae bacterium]